MKLGQTGWNIFNASCETCPMLRAGGHEGLVASYWLQDGLHADDFKRHQLARHELYYDTVECEDEDERSTLRDSDLQFGGRCKLHIASRAIKWAMEKHTTEQTLEDVHVGIKSLLQTATDLREHIPHFIGRHVSFAEGHVQPWRQREE